MYYEINVSKKERQPGWDGNPSYKHWFATDKRSCTDQLKLKKLLKDFVVKFPAPEYNISATLYSVTGEQINIQEFGLDEKEIDLSKDPKYYSYGNKGSVWADRVHIAEGGKGLTLCGQSMLASNYGRDENPGCEECIKLYKEAKRWK